MICPHMEFVPNRGCPLARFISYHLVRFSLVGFVSLHVGFTCSLCNTEVKGHRFRKRFPPEAKKEEEYFLCLTCIESARQWGCFAKSPTGGTCSHCDNRCHCRQPLSPSYAQAKTFLHWYNRCHCRQPLSPSYAQERNIFNL